MFNIETILTTELTPKPVATTSINDLPMFWLTSHELLGTVVPLNDRLILNLIAPDMVEGPWIAGGAAIAWYNNESVSYKSIEHGHDIDVFCRNEDQFNKLRDAIDKIRESSITYETDNAITYTISNGGDLLWQVQLIKVKFFDNVEDIFNHFDIRACQIATDGRTFRHAPNTLLDIKHKRLFFNVYRSGALKRYIKYTTYGYQADDGVLKLILENSVATPNKDSNNDYETIL